MKLFPLEFDDKSKESTFILYSDYQNRVFNRIGIVLSTIGWLALIIYAFMFWPEEYLTITYIFLLALVPLFIFIFVITFIKRFLPSYQPLTALANFLAGIFTVYITYKVPHDYLAPLLVLICVIFYAFFILRLRFKLALLVTVSYVVIYQIQIATSGLTINEKVLVSIGIWVVEFSCIVGGYLLESLWRRNYLQNLKIEEQQISLAQEREKSEKLLLNTFPENIAKRLKNQEEPIADYHVNVSVLFADIVNFTPLSQQFSAEEVV